MRGGVEKAQNRKIGNMVLKVLSIGQMNADIDQVIFPSENIINVSEDFKWLECEVIVY